MLLLSNYILVMFSCAYALTMLLGRQEWHPACKKRVVGYWRMEQGADLRMAQLMPLPLTVSCFSNVQIGFTLLVLAHPGSLDKRAVKHVRVCLCGVCVCVCVSVCLVG